MLKQAIQRARPVGYVRIKSEKDGGQLTKQHSTLFTYAEGGSSIEFVANFFSPAVGGYIVQVEGDAPTYLNETEFHRQYLEATHAQQGVSQG